MTEITTLMEQQGTLFQSVAGSGLEFIILVTEKMAE
jgi:hypothetical protein